MVCFHIMKDCPILILDEPTKELDEDSKGAMLALISDEAKKRLVIMVTHESHVFTDAADVITL